MGHLFCRSRWRIKGETNLQEYPCFNQAKKDWDTPNSVIYTQLNPRPFDFLDENDPNRDRTLIPRCGVMHCTQCPKIERWQYRSQKQAPCKMKPIHYEMYINDVLAACPGIAKRVGEFEFEYNLGTAANWFKFLGVASLLRAIEEWWLWVEYYHVLRDRGIPRDVALLVQGLGPSQYDPQIIGGHNFFSDLTPIQHLNGFNLQEAFIDQCEFAVDPYNSSLWSLMSRSKWLNSQTQILPSNIDFTKDLYDIMCKDDITDQERKDMVSRLTGQTTKDYKAVA